MHDVEGEKRQEVCVVVENAPANPILEVQVSKRMMSKIKECSRRSGPASVWARMKSEVLC